VQYNTIEFGDQDIHVRTLRDRQQFSDDEGKAADLGISSASWPHFGVIWQSGHVLAHIMSDYDVSNKRILEVGCGIGLASLVLNHRKEDISATDHHPEAEDFMQQNTELNEDRDIPFVCTGWTDEESCLGKFDLIIGSDILYEGEHVKQLSQFIDQHAHDSAEVILVDPGRGHHAKFSKAMVKLGYTHSQKTTIDPEYLEDDYRGQILSYQRTTTTEIQ